MIEDVTGIVVCHNTKALIKRAYESIRRFHPDMSIIVIDGSDKSNPCVAYCKSLASEMTQVISLGYNIGHGRGMHLGINEASTRYALIFDSDIEMLNSPLAIMLDMMGEDTFGVGKIGKVSTKAFNTPISYLHPFFQLINIKSYKKFHPYVHHGAPCLKTMMDIRRRGLSGKILKEFPNLDKYIKHYHQGTRRERIRRGLPQIARGWERI